MKIKASELQTVLDKLPDPYTTDKNILFVQVLKKRTCNSDYSETLVFEKQKTDDERQEWALNTSFC